MPFHGTVPAVKRTLAAGKGGWAENYIGNGRSELSAVRQYATGMGAVFLLLGLAGFIGPLVQGSNGQAFYTGSGLLLGLFAIDSVHNLVHLLFGIGGLFAGMTSWSASRVYAQVTGVIYALLFVVGLFTAGQNVGLLGNMLLFNVADNVLHAAISLVSLYFGFAPGLRPGPHRRLGAQQAGRTRRRAYQRPHSLTSEWGLSLCRIQGGTPGRGETPPPGPGPRHGRGPGSSG